jgi:hypothetical protein
VCAAEKESERGKDTGEIPKEHIQYSEHGEKFKSKTYGRLSRMLTKHKIKYIPFPPKKFPITS